MPAVPRVVNASHFNSGHYLVSTGQFARQQRLNQASDFSHVFSKPDAKWGDASMLVLARKNNQQTARLGLAVAKKHLKRAVSRNRFKRLVRESFRHHLDELRGLDIVVVARAGAAACSNRELLDTTARTWHNISKKCKNFS